MQVYIERILTNLTRPHEVQVGSQSFTVAPGSGHNMQLDIDPDAHVFAKMPHEYDWYDYGQARKYIHRFGNGYELCLFMSNQQPIQDFYGETKQTDTKSKNKNWW